MRPRTFSLSSSPSTGARHPQTGTASFLWKPSEFGPRLKRWPNDRLTSANAYSSLARQREVFARFTFHHGVRQRRLRVVFCWNPLDDLLVPLRGGVGCNASAWRPINLHTLVANGHRYGVLAGGNWDGFRLRIAIGRNKRDHAAVDLLTVERDASFDGAFGGSVIAAHQQE